MIYCLQNCRQQRHGRIRRCCCAASAVVNWHLLAIVLFVAISCHPNALFDFPSLLFKDLSQLSNINQAELASSLLSENTQRSFWMPCAMAAEPEYYRRIDLKRRVLDPARYDRNMPPRGYKDFTNVTIELLLESISAVDELAEKIFPMFYGYTRWTDQRLAFNQTEWGDERMIYYLDEIWTPTIFYWTDRGSLTIIERSHSFPALVDHTGHVILPLVITKPLMCPFNAWKFPFDSQRCLVFFYADIIESLHALKITEDSIDMPEVGEWKVKNFYVKEAATIRDFSFVKQFNNYTKAKYATDQYSMVSFIIELERSYASHILIWILPCNAMALVGFIGLFMGSSAHTKQLPFGGSIMVAEAVFLIGLSNRLPVGSKKFPILGYYYVITFCLIGAALCSSLLLGRHLSILVPFYYPNRKSRARPLQSGVSIWGSWRRSFERRRRRHHRRHSTNNNDDDDDIVDSDCDNNIDEQENDCDSPGQTATTPKRTMSSTSNNSASADDMELHAAISFPTMRQFKRQQQRTIRNLRSSPSSVYMKPVTTAATAAQYRRHATLDTSQSNNNNNNNGNHITTSNGPILKQHGINSNNTSLLLMPNGGPFSMHNGVIGQRPRITIGTTSLVADDDNGGSVPVTTYDDKLQQQLNRSSTNLQACTCGHARRQVDSINLALAARHSTSSTHVHINNLSPSLLPYQQVHDAGEQVLLSELTATQLMPIMSTQNTPIPIRMSKSCRNAALQRNRLSPRSRTSTRRKRDYSHVFTSRGLLSVFLGLQSITTVACILLWLGPSPELHV